MLGRFGDARSDLKHRSARKLRMPGREVRSPSSRWIEQPMPATCHGCRGPRRRSACVGVGSVEPRVDARAGGTQQTLYWMGGRAPRQWGGRAAAVRGGATMGGGPYALRCPFDLRNLVRPFGIGGVGSSVPRPQVTAAMRPHTAGLLLANDIISPFPTADLSLSSMTWGSSCLRVTLLPNPTRSLSRARRRLGPLPQQ